MTEKVVLTQEQINDLREKNCFSFTEEQNQIFLNCKGKKLWDCIQDGWEIIDFIENNKRDQMRDEGVFNNDDYYDYVKACDEFAHTMKIDKRKSLAYKEMLDFYFSSVNEKEILQKKYDSTRKQFMVLDKPSKDLFEELTLIRNKKNDLIKRRSILLRDDQGREFWLKKVILTKEQIESLISHRCIKLTDTQDEIVHGSISDIPFWDLIQYGNEICYYIKNAVLDRARNDGGIREDDDLDWVGDWVKHENITFL